MYRDCSLNERKLMFIQKVQEEFYDKKKQQASLDFDFSRNGRTTFEPFSGRHGNDGR